MPTRCCGGLHEWTPEQLPAGLRPAKDADLVVRCLPYPLDEARAVLPFDPQRHAVCVEFPESESPLLYRQLLRYIARHGQGVRSLRLGGVGLSEPAAGLGWFQLHAPAQESAGPVNQIWALHQTTGQPLGMQLPRLYHSLVLFAHVPADSDEEVIADARRTLQELCRTARAEASEPEAPGVPVWRFDRQSGFWRQISTRPPRSWSSVVLPPTLERELEDDIEWFHQAKTKRRYAELGLAYRRAYLFSGPPGAGKTSAAVALAGRYARPLCMFPRTDETLLAALAKAPPRALMLLEDVAEMAIEDLRELLNGLDGVSTPEDVLFVLTTNDHKPLDAYPALLRPGRVDLHLRFPAADSMAAERLLRRFFGSEAPAIPDQLSLMTGFQAPSSPASHAADAGAAVSMASVQHWLMACDRRGLNAADCLELLRSECVFRE